MKIKLPKQWRDWMRAAKLRPYSRKTYDKSSKKTGDFYMRGKGYVWRVNDNWQFQLGDTTSDFDRWALCKINNHPLPLTKASFLKTVESLIENRRDDDDV
jgi:hypothetical protein